MARSYLNDGIYIAELDGGKCRTYAGFIQELVEAFGLPVFSDNINDINYYIFSDWKYRKSIVFRLVNVKVLKKKDRQYRYILDILEMWKKYHEENDGFSILVEEL